MRACSALVCAPGRPVFWVRSRDNDIIRIRILKLRISIFELSTSSIVKPRIHTHTCACIAIDRKCKNALHTKVLCTPRLPPGSQVPAMWGRGGSGEGEGGDGGVSAREPAAVAQHPRAHASGPPTSQLLLTDWPTASPRRTSTRRAPLAGPPSRSQQTGRRWARTRSRCRAGGPGTTPPRSGTCPRST